MKLFKSKTPNTNCIQIRNKTFKQDNKLALSYTRYCHKIPKKKENAL